MEQLDKYNALRKEIFTYFGYVEDWVVIPLDDAREYYWFLTGEGHSDNIMFFTEPFTEQILKSECYYSNSIYTQCHLPKWVYRGAEYTMICADTHTDGNKFLMILDNKKEMKEMIEVNRRLNDEGWADV